MGFFDLLKARRPGDTAPEAAAAPAPAVPVLTSTSPAGEARRFVVDRTRMFDLQRTGEVAALFQVARKDRDAGWADRFFAAVWNASLEVGNPPTLRGPDGFVYLRLHLPAPAVAFDSNAIANLAAQCLERGQGIAVFASPQAQEPEYVISMGVLDCLLRYDSWDGDPQDKQELVESPMRPEKSGLQSMKLTRDTQVMIGSPSTFLLPVYTARALQAHLAARWHMPDPGIALLVSADFKPTRNFVIGRRLQDFPSDDAAGGEMRLLLWFFPPHRGLLLLPDTMAAEQLKPLSQFCGVQGTAP